MKSLFFLLCMTLGVANLAFADAEHTQTFQVADQKSEFKITYNRKSGEFSVFPIRTGDALPDKMSLFIYQDESTGRTISLKANKPKEANQLPVYTGRLDPKEGSFMGVELQFSLGGSRSKRFRQK